MGDEARRDATRAAASDAIAPDARGSASAASGSLIVRVEWKAVPVAARSSPGLTSCRTPRPPTVTPTTMWGIPDAFVVGGPQRAPEPARIVASPCELSPRVAVASRLIVESAHPQPVKLTLARRGTVAKLGELVADPKPRAIQLPILGHAAAIELEPGAIYELTADGELSAWIVAAPAMVSDASGAITLDDVPAGDHQFTAWLPPRAGQIGRTASRRVTAKSGEQVEAAIDIGR